MQQDPLHPELLALTRPLVAALGLELWGLEFARGKRSFLRVYVDAPLELRREGESVSIDQCARLSRQLGLALEVEDIVPGAYILEVSSPGLDRPFFSLEQLAEYVGQAVELQLRAPVVHAFPGRKSFRGPLLTVAGDVITLDVEDGAEGDAARVELRWQDLKRIRLCTQFAKPAPPKGPRKGQGGKKSKQAGLEQDSE